MRRLRKLCDVVGKMTMMMMMMLLFLVFSVMYNEK